MVFDINDFDETLAGTVGVGRQAPGREPRHRGAGPRVRRQGRGNSGCRRGSRLPRGDARVRHAGQSRRLVRPTRCRGRHPAVAEPGIQRRGEAVQRNAAKAPSKNSLKAFAKLTERVNGDDTYRERPSGRRPIRGPAPGRSREPGHGASAAVDALVPAKPASGPPARPRRIPSRRRRPQSGRRRQRRHAVLDRAAARPRRDRPAVPSSQGGGGVGPRAVGRQERPRPTTAGEWSTGRGSCRLRATSSSGGIARRASTASSTTSMFDSSGTARSRPTSAPSLPPSSRCTRRCAVGRWHARTLARVTASRSLPISAPATCSTVPSSQFAFAYADQNARDYEAAVAAVREGRIAVAS